MRTNEIKRIAATRLMAAIISLPLDGLAQPGQARDHLASVQAAVPVSPGGGPGFA